MDNSVKLIESPREAWQALARAVPAEVKADYLKLLVAAGFRRRLVCLVHGRTADGRLRTGA